MFQDKVLENTVSRYKAVSNLLVDARKDGIIPWDWIEDRLRRPRPVSMWDDLTDFGAVAVSGITSDAKPTRRWRRWKVAAARILSGWSR